MRIGVIATEFPPMQGGMPEFASGLVTALAASGQVRAYTPSGLRLDEALFPIHDSLSGNMRRDAEVLLKEETRTDVWLTMNCGLSPLASVLRRPLFSFVHGNDLIDPWLACGPSWVEAIRRPYAAALRHGLRRRAIRRHAPAVRHLLVISRGTASLARRYLRIGDDRMAIVPPGVGEAFFQRRQPDGGEVLRLLTVSRLSRHTRRKNVDGVLRAVAQLGDTLDIHYTVVGDGDDRPRLAALADELGLGARVDFLGSVGQRGLLEAYRRADLFVMASKATERDVEGFGIVYLEANASGVPVICSHEGGATDAVVDGRNGLLIDRSTPQAIAAGIERFIQVREKFDVDTVRAAAEGHRWPRIADRVRTVFDNHL